MADEEYARAIASAILDLIETREVRYADRDKVVARAFHVLSGRITDALQQKASALDD